jgi:hypothetical protein
MKCSLTGFVVFAVLLPIGAGAIAGCGSKEPPPPAVVQGAPPAIPAGVDPHNASLIQQHEYAREMQAKVMAKAQGMALAHKH